MEKNAQVMVYVYWASATAQKDTQVHFVLFHYATLWIAVATAVAYKVNVSANQAGLVMHATRKNVLQMQQALSATVMVSVLK